MTCLLSTESTNLKITDAIIAKMINTKYLALKLKLFSPPFNAKYTQCFDVCLLKCKKIE